MRILTAALLLASAAFGADVSGKWVATIQMTGEDGQVRKGSAFLILTQKGSDVTGTMGGSENEQHAITKGRIDGDKLTIEGPAGANRIVHLNLTVSGEQMSGDFSATGDGSTDKAKVEARRAK